VEAVGVAYAGAVAVAAGLLFTAAAPVTGVADEAAAIMTPATTATMPPMTPVTRNRMVQVEAGRVPGVGPSPAKRGASLVGWTGTGGIPCRRLAAAPRKE
jgi:hypothetical protein